MAGLTTETHHSTTATRRTIVSSSSNESPSLITTPRNQHSSDDGHSNNTNKEETTTTTTNPNGDTIPTAAHSKGKSMAERSQIPHSFWITFGTIVGLEFCSGMWQPETILRWYLSLETSIRTLSRLVLVDTARLLVQTLSTRAGGGGGDGDTIGSTTTTTWRQWVQPLAIFTVCAPLTYVFFIAPFRAGLWTGRKARRHMFHRYMGLSYLIHYVLAWVEFLTNYHQEGQHSYLCHVIAVTGVLQGTSAYFSFKVLPELNDPGYYSDKAVLSRTFVHENIFFTVMAVFGSVYYNAGSRAVLRSHWLGRGIEYAYVFGPYIVVRPWYPITRFSNAGQTYKGRTEQNKRFYETATLMVKVFYLWAKYFLGFFINFMVFLDLVKDEHWRFINGMLLLNTGTVSLSIFLHTLRFKKVLPAKLTMSIYLAQIYLTFTAIPTALEMFSAHPKLCGLCLVGLLGNATRNRRIHGVWCGVAMILLTQSTIVPTNVW